MKLEKPRSAHYRQVMDADDAYRAVGEEPYCGLRGRIGYGSWLVSIAKQAKPEMLAEGLNPNEIWLLINEQGLLCGFGQLRMYDTRDVMTWAGHIGYSILPPLRGRGYATSLLRLLLQMAHERGRSEVLLTCDVTNAPSRQVIEKCGGDFLGFYNEPPFNKRVYRIVTGGTEGTKGTEERRGPPAANFF